MSKVQTDPQIIAELHSLFRAGATPSRLVRHIVANHAQESEPYLLVQAYFREVFSIPVLQVSPNLLLAEPQGLALAGLNAHVLEQMVRGRGTSEPTNGHEASESTWLDALPARDVSESSQPFNPEGVPELANCWSRFDDSTRRFILRVIDNAQLLSDRVTILATLCESLQQQVNVLEETETRKAH